MNYINKNRKILHVANWYPNNWNDLEGIFVQEQFKLFSKNSKSYLINVQVRNSKNIFKYRHITYSENEEGFYILTRIKSAKMLEVLSTLLLLWSLFKSEYKNYDILHFHIAYPLLTFYSWWKKIIKTKLIISEHWSAYHFNFYLPQSTKKLKRVKNIFKQKIPVITVSKALLQDIKSFSDNNEFPATVIPNVIDFKYYKYCRIERLVDVPVFFMVNIWRKIKNPFPIFDALSELRQQGLNFKLHIGGYGELLENMKAYVKECNLRSHVVFLGKLNKLEISNELSKASAYLYSSNYETFSMACAQALTCGCPLIGTPLPAILEYSEINKDIVIVKNNTKSDWIISFKFYLKNMLMFNQYEIAQKAMKLFSNERIESSYQHFINTCFINQKSN